jgi:hypothetical protein
MGDVFYNLLLRLNEKCDSEAGNRNFSVTPFSKTFRIQLKLYILFVDWWDHFKARPTRDH